MAIHWPNGRTVYRYSPTSHVDTDITWRRGLYRQWLAGQTFR